MVGIKTIGKLEFPSSNLDKYFPNIPVVLNRVDNHAIVVNSKVLSLATQDTKNNWRTDRNREWRANGILIDNPMELVFNIIPKPSRNNSIARC
jgi:predicted amidohydrolase YtcJ